MLFQTHKIFLRFFKHRIFR